MFFVSWRLVFALNNEDWFSNVNGYVLRSGEGGNISFNIGTGGGIWYEARTTNNPMAAGTWYHVVGRYDGSNVEVFINGTSQNTAACTANITSSTTNLNIGCSAYTAARLFDGKIDEVRVCSTARSAGWIATKYNNQNAPATFYAVGSEQGAGVTAVTLLEFTAVGDGSDVKVGWQTTLETQNMGFDLYRSESREGPYEKLTPQLIPGGFDSPGGSYGYTDKGLVRGRLYYYLLEDVDVHGRVTRHGPICVDWDGDGLPDDWEMAYGLNPRVNDAALDSDGDGVPNWLEYARGTDPFNPDSDGDGVTDGGEKKSPGYAGGPSIAGADASVQVIASDAQGMTLELLTPDFDATPVAVAGQEFERLRVPAYVHGSTAVEGAPQLPQKGLLLDVPAGRTARLTVLESDSRVLPGYRVFPAPAHRVAENGELLEEFRWDEAAYGSNSFSPQGPAELSGRYVFRGQDRQRVLFYPLQFNPVSGELRLYTRIRVRVDYEAAAARMAAAAAAPGSGWPIPATAAYRVRTAEEGMHRISRDWLSAQGIGASEIDAIDLSRVQLFHLGEEQALEVYDAGGDGRLDAGDWIGFYAEPVPAAFAKYEGRNVYWLMDAGSASPRRMGLVDGTPAGGPPAVSHEYTLHHELNQSYVQTAPGADGLERWIFSLIAIGTGVSNPRAGLPADFSLSLPGALGSGELKLRLYAPYDLAHTAAVSVNGVDAGTAVWSGIAYNEQEFSGVGLLDGANTVSITCESGADKLGVDWFEVVYPRDFTAQADSLKFSHAGGYRYQVGGFTTADAALYDVSEPAAVARVVNTVVSPSGSDYVLEAEPAAAAGDRSYLAVAADALKTPVAIAKDRPSTLASEANGADWILITHRDLGWDGAGAAQGWVNSLVALRQSQGLRTAVVDVSGIFDEFGYGFASPQAIKDFLRYAYEHWQRPAPRFVLLVGDANYDYKNNWGLTPAPVNRVPGYLMFTSQGETIADDWYAQVSGADALADLFIGRLPAASLSQAQQMVVEDCGLRECREQQELAAAGGADGGQRAGGLGDCLREHERGSGGAFARGHGHPAALLPSGVRERYSCGERFDRGSAWGDRRRGAFSELQRARQREPVGHRADHRQPRQPRPIGCGHVDQQRDVPVCGEHGLPDGLFHLSVHGQQLAVAGRGLDAAGRSRGGGGADARGAERHRHAAGALAGALRGDFQPGRAPAGAGGGRGQAGACGQRRGGGGGGEQHVCVLRGPGNRAEGAAAAAAGGGDRRAAGGKRAAGLECGQRLRGGSGFRLQPVPAGERQCGAQPAEQRADPGALGGGRLGCRGAFRRADLFLCAHRRGCRRRRECGLGRGGRYAGGGRRRRGRQPGRGSDWGQSERRRRRRRGRGALLHFGLRRGHRPGAAHAPLRPGAARLPGLDQPAGKRSKRAPPEGAGRAALCALRSATRGRLEERAACDGT